MEKNNMGKDFVPYEAAIELKELGFDEKCMGHYWEGLFYYQTTHDHPSTMSNSIESCLAPLYQQAFRWFREKHSYNCFIVSTKTGKWFYFREDLSDFKNDSEPELTPKFETYEEAELACLRKLIEIVKQKQ